MLIERSEDQGEANSLISAVERVAGPVPLVIHPGTGWTLKHWPARRWGKLARALSERYGDMPLVTGTAVERSLCEDVVREAGGRAVSIAGRLGLGGFAALLRRSRAFVAVDSGPLHLAGVVGCPVVGLYGPVTASAAGPLCRRSRRRVLGVDIPCRPCGQMVAPPCGAERDPACMTGIGVTEVLAAVDDLIDTNR